MKNVIRRAGIAGLLVLVISALFGGMSYVYALGGGASMGGGASSKTSDGTGGSGGGSGGWLSSYSWIFYESRVSNGVEMPFRPDAPLSQYASTSEANANNNIIPSECSEHTDEGGGVWHFGRNAYGSNRYNGQYHFGILSFVRGISNSIYTYSIGSGSYGHAFSYDYNGRREKPSGATLGQDLYYGDTIVYSSAYYDDPYDNTVEARNSKNAFTQFKAAFKYYCGRDYDGADGTFNDCNGNPVWYFCWWPGMEGASYYGQSNVSAQGDISGTTDNKTTGVVQRGETEMEITAEPDENVTIKFSHNLFESGDEPENLEWSVLRRWFKEDGSEYIGYWNTDGKFTASIPEGLDGSTADLEAVSGGDKSDVLVGWGDYNDQYKVGIEQEYISDGIKYLARDVMDVKFTEEALDKKYKYCETLIGSYEGEERVRTKACVTVKVSGIPTGPRTYYSVSNVSNDRSMGWETTGIVNIQKRVDAAQAKIEKGERATITFSHNIYSSAPTEDETVHWSISRPGVLGGYSFVGTDLGPDSGDTKINVVDDSGYYIADDRSRDDGFGNYFVARDIFTIEFTAVGTYTFCETITVDGEQITTACSSVEVQETIPEGCQQYAGVWGSNYTTSGRIQGNVIKGETSVAMHVQNTRLTRTYAGWQSDVVYARPTDDVKWMGCYFPGAQALANERIATSDPHPQSFNTLPTATLQSRYLYPWTNKFTVQAVTDSSNGIFRAPTRVFDPSGALVQTNLVNTSTYKLDASMTVGDYAVRETNNIYTVRQRNDAGKEYSETISTDGRPYKTQINLANHSWFEYWCCCGCRRCTCSCHRCYYRHLNNFHGYNYASGSAEQRALSDNARLIIPYNFINTASFNISNGPVYAGDSISVSNAQVKVGYRTNEITEARYTTQVDYAEVRLVAYVSDRPADQQTGEQTQYDGSASSTNICDKGWINKKQCMEVNKYNGGTTTLNPNGSLNEQVHSGSDLDFNKTYDVFDASAGDYMCFVMAVFPWRSGPENDTSADRTTTAAGTESRWLITAPKCAVIAKKPSVSVTGGNVFTSGKITASFATKHNLYNNGDFVAYNPFNPVTSYYGSWGEEAVISNNTIENFASGAALGKTARAGSGGYGASASNYSYCQYWAPLTFSNYSSSVAGLCGSDNSPRKSGVARIDSGTVDRAALVDYLAVGDVVAGGEGSDGFGSYVKIASGTEKQILYTTAGSDISVGGYIDANTTRVVKASGTVRITSNITYNNGSYSSMTRIPKAVIYASGDIKIECGVTQVDAILIAGGTVYSCGDLSATSGDMNAATRSQNQLVVNGAIIADKVEFGRTYGNAVGTQSGASAEVINYDTSAIVWGRSMADAGESDVLTTVYVHELAPRY